MDPVQQARALLQGMNLSQVQSTLRSGGDVLQARHGFVPERLGDTEAGSLPLPRGQYARFEGGDRDNRDVFTKSEKWLGSPPAPSSEKWVSREDEVLGWAAYLTSLVNWCSLGSIQFGREVELASRWSGPVFWNSLSRDQQIRAVRLCSILRVAFANHPKISMMISGFMEGLDIIPGTSAGDLFGNASTYMGNGYELIRQLTKEYSLRSRAECLSLRMQLAGKTFTSHAADSPVADVIRQIENSIARYTRLMSTVQCVTCLD